VTNSDALAQLATSHAKAIALLARNDYFDYRDPDEGDLNDLQHRYVFRDWLTIAPGKVLADKGRSIPGSTLALFR
jgi:hypothetical protein